MNLTAGLDYLQLLELAFKRYTVLPAAFFVVFGQHFVQLTHFALGAGAVGGFLQEPFWQVV